MEITTTNFLVRWKGIIRGIFQNHRLEEADFNRQFRWMNAFLAGIKALGDNCVISLNSMVGFAVEKAQHTSALGGMLDLARLY